MDAFLNLLLALVDLAVCEVAVTGIDSFELTAIDGYQRLTKELEVTAQHDKAPAYVANARAVVMSEVGNGLEVRC